MRIAFTANGPGEVAGWLRPLLRSLYSRAPDLEALVFLVPDDYATGFEAAMVREAFPRARVYDPKSYLKFAFGARLDAAPASVDLVQYIGGDLLHAARVHARLRGRAATYKFSRRAYRRLFDRAFAVDPSNAEQLARWGTPPERIERVGNLAIDGALFEANQAPEPGTPADGILVLPGSRTYEVENLVPFFVTMAQRIARERPEIPVAFALSPFTTREQVRDAIECGGHPRMFARRGRLIAEGGRDYLESEDGSARFPVIYNALAAARHARLAVTIPGTKTIELAVLGKPAIAITPMNAPEAVTINGPLTYLDRVPLVGVPLKRAAAIAVSRRFEFHTQPNMDARTALIREVHGTVTPGRIARLALECYDDREWLDRAGGALAGLYRDHVGAAGRLADSLLGLAA
jgi:lipid-A-disaccharide synthase